MPAFDDVYRSEFRRVAGLGGSPTLYDAETLAPLVRIAVSARSIESTDEILVVTTNAGRLVVAPVTGFRK